MASRIKLRLTKLEQSAPASGLSPDAERMLVELLGRRDAMFWPWRTHRGSYRAEVRRLQREYLSGRGGLTARSQGASNWKSGHHTRNELIACHSVTAQLDGGQVTGLRLTPQGTADARAMIGDRLATCSTKATAAAYIVLERFEGCEHSGQWMSESALFGEDVCTGDNPTAWDDRTELLLPLLASGAIESTSDTWHRVYYRAVDGVELPTEPPSTLPQRPWADRAYVRAFDGERAALARSECLDGSIEIPMRCT